MELAGKVAVITGGAVRLGRALTLALAQAGCHVFIHYGRSAAPAQQTQTDAQALGIQAHIFSADLADPNAVSRIIPAAVAQFGQVDILINNAAIFPEEDNFSHTDAALWDKLFAVNLRAPFLLSQAFAAQLPANTQGKIINITDARVRHPQTDHFVYRLTKGGLWQMTEMLAHALAPRVTVNAVALGAILPPPGQDEGYLQNLAQTRVPLQRAGSAEIVTQNVLHLLTQDFLTGVVIPIDGGEFL
ncbi:MAG: SDR family NAD(P)-dependent oxidoreductase [Chloroflexi bacterium]|nr:MAG: SDR family NAD(P)-dependent oxidoreductase [Chloroflexota bacterium]